MVLKQGMSSVETYIITRERIENTLGDALSAEVRETSLHEGLNPWIVDRISMFRTLPYEQYKEKAEEEDEYTRMKNLGPYP